MKRQSVGIQSVIIGGIIAFISSIIGGLVVSYLSKNNEIETRSYDNFYNASQFFLDNYYNKFNSNTIKDLYISNYKNHLYSGLCKYLRNDHLYYACSINPFNFLITDYPSLTTGNLYILQECALEEPIDCFLRDNMNNIIPSDEVLEATKLIQYENLYITLEQQVKEFISLNYKNKLLIDDDIYEKSIGNIKEKIMEMEKNINLLNELYIAPTDIKEKVFEIDKYDIKKYYYKEGYFDFLNEEIIKLFKIELKEYLQS